MHNHIQKIFHSILRHYTTLVQVKAYAISLKCYPTGAAFQIRVARFSFFSKIFITKLKYKQKPLYNKNNFIVRLYGVSPISGKHDFIVCLHVVLSINSSLTYNCMFRKLITVIYVFCSKAIEKKLL